MDFLSTSTNCLQVLISKHQEWGSLQCTASARGPSSYASRFGLLRDWISLCGHWRSNKKQMNTYIDVDIPYPNTKVASVPCGPWGPCKNSIREGVELTDDFSVQSFLDEPKYLGERWLWFYPSCFFGLPSKLKYVSTNRWYPSSPLIFEQQSRLHGVTMREEATPILLRR